MRVVRGEAVDTGEVRVRRQVLRDRLEVEWGDPDVAGYVFGRFHGQDLAETRPELVGPEIQTVRERSDPVGAELDDAEAQFWIPFKYPSDDHGAEKDLGS